jgi:hypothetical protein
MTGRLLALIPDRALIDAIGCTSANEGMPNSSGSTSNSSGVG